MLGLSASAFAACITHRGKPQLPPTVRLMVTLSSSRLYMFNLPDVIETGHSLLSSSYHQLHQRLSEPILFPHMMPLGCYRAFNFSDAIGDAMRMANHQTLLKKIQQRDATWGYYVERTYNCIQTPSSLFPYLTS